MRVAQRNAALAAALVVLSGTAARAAEFKPVTDEVLTNPDPADWLMINRTYDEQRFSPLDQINKSNCRRPAHGLEPRHAGRHAGIDADGLQRRDVLHRAWCDVQALDATTGDLVWEYRRKYPKDMAQKNPCRQPVARQESRRCSTTWFISPRPTASRRARCADRQGPLGNQGVTTIPTAPSTAAVCWSPTARSSATAPAAHARRLLHRGP